jgi:prepilin-type N-terminal cleavage/methylation domain-containing protein/prepilin-type processing-associated H-X9-DG protein
MNRRRSGFTLIELLAVVALIAVLISLLLPAVQAAREAARRTQCANNLLQLGVAVRSYETTHRVLPPGVVDVSGPVIEAFSAYQFGWITQLLPHMEQRNVYRHLDFRVGIYQPANQTARAVLLGSLICPSEWRGRNSFGSFGSGSGPALGSEPALSSYAACHHDVEAPIDVLNKGVFFLNSHVRYDQIEDGLSHTLFLGEKQAVGDELGWASGTRSTLRNTGTPINRTQLDPGDLPPNLFGKPLEGSELPPTAELGAVPGDPAAPPATGKAATPLRVGGFGSRHPSGANFGFGDGSVRFLRLTIDPRVYLLLGARADGEPIGDDQF